MGMPGREFTATTGYRYGFNGKENDNEVKGNGNQQDYGMRIYDPRLGRFLSVDPITRDYPELTPYQFASNRPVDGIDLDGLEYYGATNIDENIKNSTVYNTYQVKASITNLIIRATPFREIGKLLKEFEKVGVDDPEFILANFKIRMRTILTLESCDCGGDNQPFSIENKFVIESKQKAGQEFLEAAFDILNVLSILPSKGSTGILAAKGTGQFFINEVRKSFGILYNVRKYSAVGINNVLKGTHKLEDVIEAGMAFVGNNAKKLFTKSGRFIGWESSDGLKRFRPSAFKKGQGKFQSNFEQRTSKEVNWDSPKGSKSNMHVDTDRSFDFKNEKL